DSELIGVRSVLRKMANALESVAVFDALNGNSRESAVEAACAFVAAEAVALLAEFDRPVPDALNTDVIRGTSHYVKIEAALLYMIGGYDINAAAIVRDLPDFVEAEAQDLAAATARNSLYLIFRLRALCSGVVRVPTREAAPYTVFDEQPALFETVLLEARLGCYEILAAGVNAYLRWLAGTEPEGLNVARERIDQARKAALPEGHFECASLADIYHLSSLLRAAIDRTSERSVLHRVPDPNTGDAAWIERFRVYLRRRVSGDAQRPGR